MIFTREDVEAAAEARVNRAEKSNTNKWAIITLVVVIIGFLLVMKVNMLAGSGVCALGIIIFLFYNSSLNKKKALAKYQLSKEWYESNKK